MAWINFFGDKVRIKDIFLRNGRCLADVFYPVGSIYISAASTSPADMFGGTWKRINGRVLIGAGQNEANTTNAWGSTSASVTNFPAGEMGGVYRHALSENELPSHSHGFKDDSHTWAWGRNPTNSIHANVSVALGSGIDGNQLTSSQGIWNSTLGTGGGSPHTNMQPYLVVYMWQRTA